MNQIPIVILSLGLIFAVTAFGHDVKSTGAANATVTPQSQPSAPRAVELKSSDGTTLKATYLAAAAPGPGALLLVEARRKDPQAQLFPEITVGIIGADHKVLALLDSHIMPASSWSDTEHYRVEIRHSAERILMKLDEKRTPS